jgi:hypothetical protein
MSRSVDEHLLPFAPSITAGPGPAAPDELACRIAEALAAHGWAHVAHPLSDDEFETVARHIGTIELRTDLRVDPERAAQQRRDLGDDARGRPVLYEAEAMDYHTDRPGVGVLAWRCVEPDATGGENQWLDVRDIAATFTPDELDALGLIEVGYAMTTESGSLEVRFAPLVERGADGPLVYWVPWRVRPLRGEDERRLLERFVAYVRTKHERGPMALRLRPGESLFLENRRMLHGRAPLPPDSRRHLVRLYIRREPHS